MIGAFAARHRGGTAALVLATAIGLAAGAAQAQYRAINTAEADSVLKPGDIMFKLLNEKSPYTSYGISAGQTVIQTLDNKFNSAAAKGDAAAVHVAIYIGNGYTAEAHGGSISTAKVGMRPLSDHAGFLFYVFRFKDQSLAAEAAAVGQRWANGRMKYKLPFDVPFRLSNFGPFAKRDALRYGKDAGRGGGPQGDDTMFCSQFAIAVYQAAAVARQLKSNSKLGSGDVRVPYGVTLHASNTSPLVLHGKLREATESKNGAQVSYLGRMLVQTPSGTKPPGPSPKMSWTPVSGGLLPSGTFIGGQEPGRQLPICRAAYNNGVHPGKVVAGKCNIGWGGKEIVLTSYQAMVTDPKAVRWVPSAGGQLPAGAIIGGEEPGRQLPICRGAYDNGVHPGKVVAGKCNFGWGSKEIVLTSYEVLVAAQ